MTDRDDFRGGYPRRGDDLTTVATMYGAFPTTGTPRHPDWPGTGAGGIGGTTPKGGFNAPAPAPVVPAPADITISHIKARITWLENELRQHAAWRDELATLRRMLTAYETPDVVPEKGEER